MTTTTPTPPKHLTGRYRAWWVSVVSTWQIDAPALEVLTLAADALRRCDDARDVLDEHGTTFVDRFGSPRARPEVAVERDSRLAYARLIRELNLDLDVAEPARLPRTRRSA
jgi:hypothetical protein